MIYFRAHRFLPLIANLFHSLHKLLALALAFSGNKIAILFLCPLLLHLHRPQTNISAYPFSTQPKHFLIRDESHFIAIFFFIESE